MGDEITTGDLAESRIVERVKIRMRLATHLRRPFRVPLRAMGRPFASRPPFHSKTWLSRFRQISGTQRHGGNLSYMPIRSGTYSICNIKNCIARDSRL